jgi:4-carboxymuconolactone decarboxylase
MRLAKLRPDELDGEQRALYDEIAGGPRARGPQAFRLTDDDGGLAGPFNAMLLSPAVGAALQALGSRLRYGSHLDDRTREIVILVVAHHWASEFEIHAHEAVGEQVGLSPDERAALREGRLGDLPDPDERLAAETAAALAAHGDLTDAQYAAAVRLGAAALFEITTFVGYYATLALQLRVYRVAVPEA